MKKTIGLLLSAVLLFSVYSISASASDADSIFYGHQLSPSMTSGDYTYYLMDNDLAVIERYSGNVARLEIPSALDGYRVAGVEWYAFNNLENLRELIFPTGIIAIDIDAVSNCPNLEAVTIQEGIQSLYMWSFYDCPKLQALSLPNSLQNFYYSDYDDQHLNMVFTVGRGSYAEESCKANNLNYQYDPQVWVKSYHLDVLESHIMVIRFSSTKMRSLVIPLMIRVPVLRSRRILQLMMESPLRYMKTKEKY